MLGQPSRTRRLANEPDRERGEPATDAFEPAPARLSGAIRLANRAGAQPITAIPFTSIAMGVGSALISIVVRVGLGLPGPAKHSA